MSENFILFILIIVSTTMMVCGFVDYCTRKISNLVPIILLICGLALVLFDGEKYWFDASLWSRTMGFIIPIIASLPFWLTNKGIGGGDVKLLPALGFVFGLEIFLNMSLIVCLLIIGNRLLGSKSPSIPVAYFFNLAYIIYFALTLFDFKMIWVF